MAESGRIHAAGVGDGIGIECIPGASDGKSMQNHGTIHAAGAGDGMGIECVPGASDGKESVCNVRDLSSIPGWGRSPGEGNGYPLKYSCLENPMDREA